MMLRTLKVAPLARQIVPQAPSLRTWCSGAVNVLFLSPSESPYKEISRLDIRCFRFSRDTLVAFQWVKFFFSTEIHE